MIVLVAFSLSTSLFNFSYMPWILVKLFFELEADSTTSGISGFPANTPAIIKYFGLNLVIISVENIAASTIPVLVR